MGTPSRKPRPSAPDKTQVNQPGGGKADGEKIDSNQEASTAQTPMPELPAKIPENQVGGEKTDLEKPSPDTEVPIAKPEKMMLKDIKGMVLN